MNQAQYHTYLQTETDNILQFKAAEEKATGRQLSRNAAAAMWVERYAASFQNRIALDCTDVRIRLMS